MDTSTSTQTKHNATAPLRPGAWLSLKAHLPYRHLLRPVYEQVENLLYAERGVPIWLGDQCVRCAVNAAPRFSNEPDQVEKRMLMARLFENLSAGDLFLDVGSHIGLYAIGAALRVGDAGRVIAFEARPATAVKLARNVALNGLSDRIEIHEVTLSSTGGMSDAPKKEWTSSERRERRLKVRTVPLDYYFEPRRRTVAKIDVDGEELAVLRSASRLLASSAVVFVELNPTAWRPDVETVWHELQVLCREHGRTISLLDGRPLEFPAHRRVQLVKSR